MKPGSRRRQGGATYFALLLAVAVTGLGLGAGASMLANSMRRDKEADLMFAGDQIRRALENYHALNAAGQYPFPRDLDALLKDPYQPGLVRHLRRIYPDPMSDSGKWELIIGQGNGIIGVRSSSAAAPLKREGFPKLYERFKAARSYADWRFIAAGGVPAQPVDPQAGGATPLTGAAFGSLPPLAPAAAPAAPQEPPRPQTLIERLQGILGTEPAPEPAQRVPEPPADAAPRLVADPAAPVPAAAASPVPAASAPKPPATPPGTPTAAVPASQAPGSAVPPGQAPAGTPAAPPAPTGTVAPAPGTAPPGAEAGATGAPAGGGASAPATPSPPAAPASDQVQPFIMKPFGS